MAHVKDLRNFANMPYLAVTTNHAKKTKALHTFFLVQVTTNPKMTPSYSSGCTESTNSIMHPLIAFNFPLRFTKI
ncbi:hypothetical protein L3055_11150, partial [Corynebacterium sp. MC-02]|uniref:hypothetical protein n=1 Tax=Corynebacterium pseudokroppenstedtii TaxID=2804917 RepID=UPI001F2947B8